MRQNSVDFLNPGERTGRAVWYLAWPVMLEQLLVILVHYINTAMVGFTGANATASIALYTSINWFTNGIFAACAIGFGVIVGNLIGAGDNEGAKRIIRQALTATLIIGFVMALITWSVAPYFPRWMGVDPALFEDSTAYISIMASAFIFTMGIQVSSYILRCSGDTRTPLVFNTATNVINIVLNMFLIYETRTMHIFGFTFTMFGFGLGVKGAAIGTVGATAFSGAMLVLALFQKNRPLHVSLKENYRIDLKIWKEMVRLGWPVAFERILLSFAQAAMTMITTGISTAALAAHQIAVTAESIVFMPSFGMQTAATTLVSQSLGARKLELTYRYSRYCLVSSFLFVGALGAALYFCSTFLVSLLTNDAEVIRMGSEVLKVIAFSEGLYGAANTATGILRGARDMRWSFITAMVGMWVVRIPIAYALAKYTGLGLTGVWIGMLGDAVARFVVSYLRFRSKKWIKLPDLSPAREQ